MLEQPVQSFSRSTSDSAIAEGCPDLHLPWRIWYARDVVHFWRSDDGVAHEITSAAGADQGCALASPAYCSVVSGPLRGACRLISESDEGARMFLFSDDIKIWVHPSRLQLACDSIEDALSDVGLSISTSKTKIWTQSTSIELPAAFRRFIVLSCTV